MRIFVKILVGLVVALVSVAAGAAGFAQFGSEMKLHRIVKVQVTPIPLPADQAALDRGAIFTCHGAVPSAMAPTAPAKLSLTTAVFS